MPVDRVVVGSVDLAHGEEEDGGVKVRQTEAVAAVEGGGGGRKEEMEGGEEEASKEKGFVRER